MAKFLPNVLCPLGRRLVWFLVLVRAMFAAHVGEFVKLSKRKQVFVASGFADGDLYTIRTPVSPKG